MAKSKDATAQPNCFTFFAGAVMPGIATRDGLHDRLLLLGSGAHGGHRTGMPVYNEATFDGDHAVTGASLWEVVNTEGRAHHVLGYRRAAEADAFMLVVTGVPGASSTARQEILRVKGAPARVIGGSCRKPGGRISSIEELWRFAMGDAVLVRAADGKAYLLQRMPEGIICTRAPHSVDVGFKVRTAMGLIKDEDRKTADCGYHMLVELVEKEQATPEVLVALLEGNENRFGRERGERDSLVAKRFAAAFALHANSLSDDFFWDVSWGKSGLVYVTTDREEYTVDTSIGDTESAYAPATRPLRKAA